MGQHDQEEHKETPGTLGCSCIGLYLALTRLNRTFPSVFRLFQIIFQIIFCVVPKLHVSSKSMVFVIFR